ncbi:unnamed protein product [Caenorhabditis sp. 36 PRJEB53466]|nr:unnamed protein product [Caenorhabditis sp. 36 PRJEB53466]
MPVVNTANFVDRLRDVTKRIDIRPTLQNVSRRWQGAYEALAVGSPFQVQEFYKYIKVYKQCPSNDLIFMNMTVQLARAALFPTKSMFKQMLKFEKHMDDLIVAEGHNGIYGSRGIEILACHNEQFIKSYRKFKRRQDMKKVEKDMKAAKKHSKILAAVKEARARVRHAEMMRNEAPLIYPTVVHVPHSQKIVMPIIGPPVLVQTEPVNVSEKVPIVPVVEVPVAQVTDELTEIKKYCEILKTHMEEAEKKRERDDVAEKMNEMVEQLISTANKTEAEGQSEKEDDESEEEEDEDDDDVDREEKEEEDEKSAPCHEDSHQVEDKEVSGEETKILLEKDMSLESAESDDDFEKEDAAESDDDDVEMERIEEKEIESLEYELL